ncbi:M23 family metallopeptidase [Geitlerinema sp. PCC 7407]|uniref:M23 family metallopeptidase n=1 Tax=Geitlerinema sp. PCC 7407 TaxID=1173025 RepID=UPI00029FF9EF|nr:M23 family metallopeptidase [Geitlerinema sp. PCC 7407]AFY68176.1 Peptidase M23 [Geitlerinema sp. PCC 7407]
MTVAPSSTPFAAQRPWLGTLLGAAVGLTATLPAQALEVQIKPEQPELGDTISVLIQTDQVSDPPSVTVNDKTYPVFEIAPQRYRAFLPTTPLDAPGARTVRISGEGETRNLAVWVKNRSFPTQSIWLPPGKDDLEGTDREFDLVDAFKATVSPQKFWNGPFTRPNQGEVTTVFGVRRYYNGDFAEDYYHRGVDYGGAQGSPVVAPAAGRVALVGREADGFEIHGNTVGIDHGQGVLSILIHLSRIDVKEGDMVRAGQVVGAVGSTGASTGPHLHWGLYVNGQAVDPAPWRYESLQ